MVRTSFGKPIVRKKLPLTSGALLFAFLLAVPSANIASGNSGLVERAVSEYEVKAAYIYNFAKFIDWPMNAFSTKGAPINIGIIGDNEFGALLENIVKDKTVKEHAIQVHLIKWPADLHTCHMVYVGSSEQKRFRQIVDSLQGYPILTITEVEESSQAKGIMNLFVEGGKVQFEVNIALAEKAQLKISSKLLRLARGIVGTYSGKGE